MLKNHALQNLKDPNMSYMTNIKFKIVQDRYLKHFLFIAFFLGVYSLKAQQIVTPIVLKTKPFKMGKVRLLDGPFKHAEQVEAAYLLKLEPDRLLSGFRKEAGLEPKAPKYEGWESEGVAGHTLGHYLSACAMYYATSKNTRYLERVNTIINELELCQNANGDGYVAATPGGKKIFQEVAAGNIRSQGFDLNGGWVPLYVMHKVLAGLIDAYQFVGNKKALSVANSLGIWLCKTFSQLDDEKMQLVLACEFGGMNEALANLYEITHNANFLKLAKRFDDHKYIMDALSQKKDELEGKHANTQIPKIIGAARLYELTGNKRDSVIANFFWNTVVKHHTYVNGGNSDGEHFGAPDKLNERLGTSTTETCNTYNMLKLTTHLFSLQAKPEYSDYYERAVFNHVLASQNPIDGMCTYYTPLVSGAIKIYMSPFNSFVCCSGSGMENHVKYGDFIYSRGSDKSLFVNLFIPSVVDWEDQGITLTQTTDIPSSNTSDLSIETKTPKHCIIRIRNPKWATKTTIKINNKTISINALRDSYISLERTWQNGDKIEITFDMDLYTVAMPDNPDRVGIFYGPALLGGELGKNEPDLTKDIPVLITNKRPISQWLTKVSDKPLQFKTKGVASPADITLIPFYNMHHQHYVVYWDVFDQQQWAKTEKAYKTELARLQQLDKITMDLITLGEMQPERDHNFRGEGLGNGMSNKKKWRAAWVGGWFAFDMKVLPDAPVDLLVTYWGGETPEKEFEISIDNQILITQKISNNKPGEFFEMSYQIPQEQTKGKDKVTIKFKGVNKNWTGAIYNARVIKRQKEITVD